MKARQEEKHAMKDLALCVLHVLFAFSRCIYARLSRIVILFGAFNGRAQSIVTLSLSLSLSMLALLSAVLLSKLGGSLADRSCVMLRSEKERQALLLKRVDQWDVARLKTARDGSEEVREIEFSRLLRRLLRIAVQSTCADVSLEIQHGLK